jgi:hypothetical protein
MNRIVILAAAAGVLLAGAASAQPSTDAIRVATAGKAPVQVKAEVYQAARKLCQATVPGYAYRYFEAKACIDGTVRDTLAQTQLSGASVAAR